MNTHPLDDSTILDLCMIHREHGPASDFRQLYHAGELAQAHGLALRNPAHRLLWLSIASACAALAANGRRVLAHHEPRKWFTIEPSALQPYGR
jgi:hypothetical protein